MTSPVSPAHLAGPLWAVTSYFNPAGYRRRKANYRVFRERLPLPLLTVEWSPTGQFELQPGDADILIQLTGGDVMWQKERLLNIGVERLPSQCKHVAWVDCDLVFEREGLRVPPPVIELGSLEAIKEMVKLEMGIALMPSWVAAGDSSVVLVPLTGKKLTRRWGIAHRKGRRLSHGEETFVKLCAAAGAKLTGGEAG